MNHLRGKRYALTLRVAIKLGPDLNSSALQNMPRKVFHSEREYILSEHATEYAWIFEIEELAKSWKDYTPEVGKQAQADVVAKAVACAINMDRARGQEIVIGKSGEIHSV